MGAVVDLNTGVDSVPDIILQGTCLDILRHMLFKAWSAIGRSRRSHSDKIFDLHIHNSTFSVTLTPATAALLAQT